MSNTLYMPLYIADYLTDAAHLTAAEHGAYLLLIMNYWQRGAPLPDDDRKLCRIAKMTPAEWEEASLNVREFFQSVDGFLHHKRIDAELQKAVEKSAKARQSANARHAPVLQADSERDANAERSQIEGNALKVKVKDKDISLDIPPQNPSGSSPPTNSKSVRSSRLGTRLPEGWTPSDSGWAKACELLGRDRAERELQKLHAWAANASDAKGLKRDWEKTWNGWVLRVVDELPKARAGPAYQAKPTFGDLARLLPLDGSHERPDHDDSLQSPFASDPRFRRFAG
jgi:uncharacterized protein YdaU (DUF1376 family)